MLNRSASLVMSTSVLKASLDKLDIKRQSPSILYVSSHGNNQIKLESCDEANKMALNSQTDRLVWSVSRFEFKCSQ